MINWTATRDENLVIANIAARAFKVYKGDYPYQDIMMNIEACHCNGTPLRLKDLLAADDFNFSHDIAGIYNHLDRETGKLKGSFSPRFAVRAPDDTVKGGIK